MRGTGVAVLLGSVLVTTACAAHGCVHLTDSDSAAFFDGLNVGDAVQVL